MMENIKNFLKGIKNAISNFLIQRDMDTFAIWGLWLVFLFAVLSSIAHVAAMFGDGDQWAGMLPALAVDGGLALATYALGRFDNKWVKGGFFAFMFLSVFANLDYTLQKLLGGPVTLDSIWRLDAWQLIKVGAKSSPPLLGAMMMEINTGVAELKRLQSTPQPSTALSTVRQSEPSSNPNVSVDKPSTPLSTPRQSSRLKAAKRRALPFQPDLTVPVLKRGNHQLEPSITPSTDRKNVNSEGVEASSGSHQVIRPTMVDVEDEELQKSIDIVRLFRLNNNLSETARQYGFTVEGVRVRIKNLWKDPKQQTWVEAQIPDWVEKNRHKFLAD